MTGYEMMIDGDKVSGSSPIPRVRRQPDFGVKCGSSREWPELGCDGVRITLCRWLKPNAARIIT